MEQKLFTEFPEITKNDWIAQVTKDLKGKNFDDTLVWHSLDNFDIQPYYAKEDLSDLPLSAIQAAQKNKKTGSWQNRPSVKYTNERETNSLIINYLQRGADAVNIDFLNKDINQVDLVKLLNNIKLSDTPIFFTTLQGTELLTNLAKFVHYLPKGGLQVDVIANSFSKTSSEGDKLTWECTKKVMIETEQFPNFQALIVSSHVFHNAGANAVQELAFTIAAAVENLDKLTDLGLSAEQVINKLEFSVSVGTNYFVEIAKLRALRYLWSKILESYDCHSLIINCQIHCQTSSFYDSTLSPYTNMLRATTEAMSAVMGGCDALTVLAYDTVIGEQNSELGERIARNVSILMREEAHLDKTIDPSAGSYYIENLTNQLSVAAWKLFQQVEGLGGISAAFEKGFIKDEINRSFEAKVRNLQDGKVMVGVNKFRVEPENESKVVKNSTESAIYLENRRLSEVFE
ncbi:methylmalonyl-CoA mutase subunit beta [Emticicia sp. W12TSBA100-4]|uniref:methylmalonyl-CoA mutase subunit beta n=1 Tax=Emticicia sp. W12TSBA100-4 TaxID=3160965 RepID=UPI0033060544